MADSMLGVFDMDVDQGRLLNNMVMLEDTSEADRAALAHAVAFCIDMANAMGMTNNSKVATAFATTRPDYDAVLTNYGLVCLVMDAIDTKREEALLRWGMDHPGQDQPKGWCCAQHLLPRVVDELSDKYGVATIDPKDND